MSSVAGPNGITSGLVFEYDMANIQKSWKGKPTTNLHTAPTSLNTWSIQTHASVTANVSTDVFGGITADRYIFDGLGTSNQVYLRNVTPTANLPYTVSTYIKYVSGDTKINVTAYTYGTPQQYNGVTATFINANTLTLTTIGNSTNTGYSYIGNGWFRVWFTFTQTVVTGAVEYNINHELLGAISSYAASTWDICCSQLEQNSFVTPFVNGSRLTTQAILDLTGNNTITASSLTYAIDGTFSYNGSTDYLSIPHNASAFTFASEMTLEIILQPLENDANRRNPFNKAYGGYGTLTHEPSGTINYYYGNSGGNGSPYTMLGSDTVSQNEIAVMCVTRNTSTVTWYKNGVLSSSGANAYGVLATDTNPINIGTGYAGAYLGNIFSVKLYNRALTASEVRQNFNALRGRYNL